MSSRVELGPSAERAFRALDPEARKEVARRLDALDSTDPAGVESRGPDGVTVLPAGEHLLYCVVREGRVLVLAIRSRDDSLPEAAWRTLASRAAGPARALGSVPVSPGSPGRGLGGTSLAGLFRDLVQDLRFALRGFRRSPGFVVVTSAVLALGLGANTAVFGVVNNVFLANLPFADGDRLLRVKDYRAAPGGARLEVNMTPVSFRAVREGSRVFSGVAAQRPGSGTLTGRDAPTRVSVVGVSAGWADLLGVSPVSGRAFTSGEERLGAEAGVVLLAHGFWTDRFGADPGVLDGTLSLDGRPHRVVGIMPPGFRYPYSADLWRPEVFPATDARSHDLNVVGRLRPGAGLDVARRDLARVARELAARHPDSYGELGIMTMPVREDFIQDGGRMVAALLGAVGFLLLLACLNVANLLVARFLGRRRELGIRTALGAGWSRQLRQHLTETVFLFMVGGVAGLGLTAWWGGFLADLVPWVLRRQLDLGAVVLDPPVIAFALLLSLVVGLVFGGLAALRGGRPDVQSLLRDGGSRGTGGGGTSRFQSVLAVGQVALALVLLTGAGLMARHLARLQGEDLGFRTEELLTLRVNLEGTEYREAGARAALVDRLVTEVESVPGVAAAGITTVNPLCCGDWGVQVRRADADPADPASTVVINHRFVSPGFHEAMGIPLVRGRTFSRADGRDGRPVAIVDERMARHFWPGEDPVGKRLRRTRAPPDAPPVTVVGVVGTVKDAGDYVDTWYLPYAQRPTGRSTHLLHLMVRGAGTDGDVAALAPPVEEAVRGVAPDLALYEVRPMARVQEEALAQERLGSRLVQGFGGLGLILAGFGVYGLMSYLVSRRRRELATRMAVGASRSDVVRLVLGRAVVLTSQGVGLGLVGALALGLVLRAVIPGIPAPGPVLLLSLGGILFVTALLATWIPARRAAGVEPARAFRG